MNPKDCKAGNKKILVETLRLNFHQRFKTKVTHSVKAKTSLDEKFFLEARPNYWSYKRRKETSDCQH